MFTKRDCFCKVFSIFFRSRGRRRHRPSLAAKDEKGPVSTADWKTDVIKGNGDVIKTTEAKHFLVVVNIIAFYPRTFLFGIHNCPADVHNTVPYVHRSICDSSWSDAIEKKTIMWYCVAVCHEKRVNDVSSWLLNRRHYHRATPRGQFSQISETCKWLARFRVLMQAQFLSNLNFQLLFTAQIVV